MHGAVGKARGMRFQRAIQNLNPPNINVLNNKNKTKPSFRKSQHIKYRALASTKVVEIELNAKVALGFLSPLFTGAQSVGWRPRYRDYCFRSQHPPCHVGCTWELGDVGRSGNFNYFFTRKTVAGLVCAYLQRCASEHFDL